MDSVKRFGDPSHTPERRLVARRAGWGNPLQVGKQKR